MLEYDFGFEEDVVVPSLGLLVCFALLVIFNFIRLVFVLWNVVDFFQRFFPSSSWMMNMSWMTSNTIFAVVTLASMRALVNRGGRMMLVDMVI